MSRWRRAGLAVALVLALTGCSEAPTVTRLPDAGSTTTAPRPSASAVDLPDVKKRAGIADCPTTDAKVAALPDGLPDVTVPCLGGGREVRLAGLRGRPMMINLWAQWCGPCREEAPLLSEVAERNTSSLVILGVDYRDPQPALALEFAEAAGWRYPQLQDTDDAFARFQILGPPVTVFVRADGTIAAWHRAPFTSTGQIEQLVRQHLGVTL